MGSNWGSTFTNVISQYFQWIPSGKSILGEICLPIFITGQRHASQPLSRASFGRNAFKRPELRNLAWKSESHGRRE
jgi:hypothetical protein